jgi:hypothetical protein
MPSINSVFVAAVHDGLLAGTLPMTYRFEGKEFYSKVRTSACTSGCTEAESEAPLLLAARRTDILSRIGVPPDEVGPNAKTCP